MLYLFIFTWKGQAALLQRRGLTPGMTASGDIFRGHNRESASDSRWEEARMVLNTPRCTGSADNEGVHGVQADKPWRGWGAGHPQPDGLGREPGGSRACASSAEGTTTYLTALG